MSLSIIKKYFSIDKNVILLLFRNFNNYFAEQSFLSPTMSIKALNYVGQLFNNNGKIKDWETIKLEFNLELNLENKLYFS